MFLFKILLACLILKSEWLAKGKPIHKERHGKTSIYMYMYLKNEMSAKSNTYNVGLLILRTKGTFLYLGRA